jgi:hypothetical protein
MATTVPMPSWPRTMGPGSGKSPFQRCGSVPQMPAKSSFTVMLLGGGAEMGKESMETGDLGVGDMTAQRVVALVVIVRSAKRVHVMDWDGEGGWIE